MVFRHSRKKKTIATAHSFRKGAETHFKGRNRAYDDETENYPEFKDLQLLER